MGKGVLNGYSSTRVSLWDSLMFGRVLSSTRLVPLFPYEYIHSRTTVGLSPYYGYAYCTVQYYIGIRLARTISKSVQWGQLTSRAQ